MTSRFPGGAALAFLCFSVLCARAQSQPGFRFFSQPYLIPERGYVTSYAVLTESNRFSFIPPSKWAAKANSTERIVTLQPDTLEVAVVIRWLDILTNQAPKDATNQWRQLTSERFPESQIVEEFGGYSAAGKGEGFDLERTVRGRAKLSTRVVFLQYDNGVVELSLTTPAQKLADYHLTFGHLLASFTIEPWPRRARARDGETNN